MIDLAYDGKVGFATTAFFGVGSAFAYQCGWQYFSLTGVCVIAQAIQELSCALFTYRQQLIEREAGYRDKVLSAWQYSFGVHSSLSAIQGVFIALIAKRNKIPLNQLISYIAVTTTISTIVSLFFFLVGEKTRVNQNMEDPDRNNLYHISTQAFEKYFFVSTALLVLNPVVLMGGIYLGKRRGT